MSVDQEKAGRIRGGGLFDRFGRQHTDLRVSVTDRCNLRCTYCMPEEVLFRPREELLTYEEIAKVVSIATREGIRTVRLTGGEPLVRAGLERLVRMLADLPMLEEVALTTNGLLLADQAEGLARAGLARINVSLDSLSPERFAEISRRSGLEQVLAGLSQARACGFHKIRINAVSIRGLTETEILPLAQFCRKEGFHLRFIEFMPLDADAAWANESVLTGENVRCILEEDCGPLTPVPVSDSGQPAVDYAYADGQGKVGFINPVSQPFCDCCDRLRLTADGQFQNCLFSKAEWDVRHVIRNGGGDDQVAQLLVNCVRAKQAGHGIGTEHFERPERAMYQIGG